MDAAVDKTQKCVPNFVASIFNILINRHMLIADYTRCLYSTPSSTDELPKFQNLFARQKCVFQLVENYNKALNYAILKSPFVRILETDC